MSIDHITTKAVSEMIPNHRNILGETLRTVFRLSSQALAVAPSPSGE